MAAPFGEDGRFLQRVCDEEAATLFVSTGPSFPIETPSVHVAPGPVASDPDVDDGQEAYAALHASALIAFSPDAASELARLRKQGDRDNIHVIQPGPLAIFGTAGAGAESPALKSLGVDGPYVVYVGERRGAKNEKNAGLLFEALSLVPAQVRPQLVCLGGAPELEPELAALAAETRVSLFDPAPSDLPAIYAGATALVITAIRGEANISAIEAMASGCPVIAVRNPTTEQLIGDAGILLDWNNADALATALSNLREREVRNRLVEAGVERADRFSHSQAAKKMADVLTATAAAARSGTGAASNALWAHLIAAARKADERRGVAAKAEHELEKLSQMARERGAAFETLQVEFAEAKAEAQSLSDSRSALEAELSAAQAESKSLRESRAALESELSTARAEVKSLDELRARLATELGKARAERKLLSESQVALETELNGALEEAKSLSKVRDRLQTELSSTRQQMAERSDRLAEVTRKCDELNEAVDRQASEIVRLDLVIAGFRTKLAEAAEVNDVVGWRRKNLRPSVAERESLQEQIGQLEKTIADMKLSPFWRGRERVVRLMRALRFRRRGMEQWEQR